ncbi:MAG: hypothetical protein KBF93_05110 [Leptospiraceae bacterium]|nr:hypothetical protein [Leptospiraceae bacterium]
MKRCTISLHKVDFSNEHLDLFFEVDSMLETYETFPNKMEDLLLQKKILCSKKKPHRKIYLDYEGEISNQRGWVQILWKGIYQNDKNLFPEEIEVSLQGDKSLRVEYC